MPQSEQSILDIYLDRRKIGTLSSASGDFNVFAFDEDYIGDQDRPTLSLSFKSQTGDLITRPMMSRTKVSTFFSNLLPEGHLRSYLAKANGVNPQREFSLLSALGKDLPGAVFANPRNEQEVFEAELQPKRTRVTTPKMRFSLAGVQLKFSALAEARGGLTIPASGVGGDSILKLPSLTYPNVPENEYSMMRLAQLSGITVPAIQLLPTDQIENLPDMAIPQNGNTFVIKRFDRTKSGRIHIEDFAQVFGLYSSKKYKGFSYNNIASVLWLEADEDDIIEFVRRLVFNLAIGNADMHLKNWSLIYRDGRKAHLSPGYDFVSTIVYVDDPNLALTLGKTKNMYAINMDDFRYLADKAKLPSGLIVKAVKESVEAIKSAWLAHSGDLALDERMRKKIDKHMLKLPLFQLTSRN